MSLIGRTLSRYEILEEISRGGMGIVYRARDVRLNREVALKVLPADLVADPARRARFVQEAQAASSLEHPHIAVIHEIDEVDGVSFIAMELVRGEKLSDLIGRGPLPAGRALDLATEIAEGLARAHEKGIVHRDLKPANVMLTEDGHAKIIDFGLAKLVDALSGDSSGQTVLKNETDPGIVLGTVTYMSPEQARGGRVDHRSDIFSFGVLLHEMITGRPPFRGNTGIDTMHAILHDPVPPLPPLGPSATAEAAGDVQRLLEKCLAKDPDSRYQGMRDVVVDLRAARRRLESTTMTPASAIGAAARSGAWTREGFMDAQKYAYGAVVLVVVLLAGFVALKSRWTSPPAPATGSKPSVAVLYFENNTGNPQLDWLRTGLTDMLVTDLSQSPDVEVLPTDRLVQILGDMKRQDDRVISFDTVQEIAKRAGVKSVILGSYVKAGDTIRINLKLQEATSGRIVTAERVEANGESNLFPTIDDLTKRIKAKFMLPGSVDPTKGFFTSPVVVSSTTSTVVDRDLKDVTTSSIDAYRYYAEGINLHERSRELEAIPLLEKAVEIDLSFAMALAKLSNIHSNLLHLAQSEEYGKRAFEHLDRLTTRERYYVEGTYYFNTPGPDNQRKAIAAYEKAIQLYPDHASARNNLAVLYTQQERYEDAIREYEELRRRGMTFPASHAGLANAYESLGQIEKAYQVHQEFLERNADNAQGYFTFGNFLTRWGKLDDALAAFAKSEALDPANLNPVNGRRAVYILKEQWGEVDAIDRKLGQSSDLARRFQADMGRALEALYHGHSTEALKFYDAAASEGGGPLAAQARIQSANVLLERGQPAAALAEAQRAIAIARGGRGAGPGLGVTAIAQARLGHEREAAKAQDDLIKQATEAGTVVATRGSHDALGRLALERHDTARAIQELKQAESMLPPNPVVGGGPGDGGAGVPIWFDLGTAYLAAGNDTGAATRFERIVNAGSGRVPNPIAFIRSLYFLGQISERKGDRAKAAEYYRRFLQYWGDGDIDREQVAAARQKLSGTVTSNQ